MNKERRTSTQIDDKIVPKSKPSIQPKKGTEPAKATGVVSFDFKILGSRNIEAVSNPVKETLIRSLCIIPHHNFSLGRR